MTWLWRVNERAGVSLVRSVDKQLELVGRAVVTPQPVRIAITDALGLMCAEEVTAVRPLPGFHQAAIDGYAVRAVDVGGEKPLARGSRGEEDNGAEPGNAAEQATTAVVLPVVGRVSAGSQQSLRLQPQQAVRVHTGAPLPTVADAVVPLEWTDRGIRKVTVLRPVHSGEFVRRPGDDIEPGDVAVSPGSILGAAQIGLLAAVGKPKVLVYPRPRVSVISVGRELVDIDRDPGLGQVLDVNSYAIAAAVKEAGADVHRVGIVAGEPRQMKQVIEDEMGRSEIVLIAGAVGGAGSEQIQDVLREIGDIDTTRVAMHPGSVQGIGLIGPQRVPVVLLPANPVSAMVIVEVFVRPMVRMALGKRSATRRCVRARAVNRVASRAGRRGFIRARLMRDAHTQDYLVEGLGGVSGAPAHLLAGMGEANALIQVPEDVTDIRPGDIVDVLFLTNAT